MMSRTLSRRTVLRGFGTALALPLLDVMRPVAALAGTASASAATTAAGHPVRMAFLFVPNGVNMDHWRPKSVGFDYDLPSVLEPLARVKDNVNVLSGLTHDKGRANGDGPGDHARSASVFLTGAQPRKTDGANLRSGTSVDQAAAQRIGKLTRFPSLELGVEGGRNAGNCDSGYSCAYSHNISWASESAPMAKEINPKLVFERLFAGQDAAAGSKAAREREFYKKSLLDFVADDAGALYKKLGLADQRKLDEYLAGVRAIERRIEQTAKHSPTRLDLDDFIIPDGIPDDYQEHVRLMCDMMVLAFQADLTRVATCMFCRAGSNRSYPEVEVRDGHHDLSHHGGDPEKLEKIRKINRFHVAQYAYMLERLRAIPEGEGTLLDNCMIMYGSGLSDGNRHNHDDLPVLLAGKAGGTITPGRHIFCPPETPMNNLFLSMLDRIGAPVDYLGDSTGRLNNLRV